MEKMSMDVMPAITESFEDMFEDEEAEYTYVSLNREDSDTGAEDVLFGDVSGKIKTFSILTPENPNAEKLTPEENNKLLQEFKTYTKNRHIQYIPVEGSYGSKEHSYICINLTLGETTEIAEKFGQESFFFGKTLNAVGNDRHTASKIQYYARKGEDKSYELVETSNKIDDARAYEDFFSRHGDNKFNIYMKCFNESYDDLKPIVNMKNMDESLEENRITRSRAYHRACAYKGKP